MCHQLDGLWPELSVLCVIVRQVCEFAMRLKRTLFVVFCVLSCFLFVFFFFFFQAEDGIRDLIVTGVQTCALPILSSLLLTFGISIALVNLAQLLFTSDLRSVEYLTGSWVVGPLALSKARVVAFAVASALTGLSFLLLQRTRLGKAIRATSQNREVAMVCGIDVRRIHLVTFGLSAALAGAGGALIAVIVAIQPEMGQIWTFKSFLVIVLGGAGNYPGALLGGILLGLIEQVASLFLTT